MDKKKSIAGDVEKVHRVLARFVQAEKVSPKTKPVRFVTTEYAFGVSFTDRTWTARGLNSNWYVIDGIIADKYNVYASSASNVAYELRLISEADDEAFQRWMRQERDKKDAESDIEKMKDIAREYGFDVRKKASK